MTTIIRTLFCVTNENISRKSPCILRESNKTGKFDRVVRHKSERAAQIAEPVKMPAHFVNDSRIFVCPDSIPGSKKP
jgi:hypothetical protein